MNRILSIFMAFAGFWFASTAHAAVVNSLILNEANAVSTNSYLEGSSSDATLGRLQGNGQDWMEFMVVQGDDLGGGNFSNTLDLRGWTLQWSYNKDNANADFGSGIITFSYDDLWAAVPRGTMITVSEWQQLWYAPGPDVHGGLARMGGIDGLGNQKGDPYDSGSHTLLDLSTDTYWNPGANGGGLNGDWRIHVYAGERNLDDSFKYFSFEGTISELIDGDLVTKTLVGVDDDALFVVNNDEWRYSIKDASDNLIQGPIGERLTGWTGGGINSGEVLKLEEFAYGLGAEDGRPTQDDYLGVTIAGYQDGSSSSFAGENIWSSGNFTQDFNGLREWLLYGDANLDGIVGVADYNLWLQRDGNNWVNGDFNGDGIVGIADYNLWLQREFVIPPEGSLLMSGMSFSSFSANPVPEPSCLASIVIGILLVAACGRTRKGVARP